MPLIQYKLWRPTEDVRKTVNQVIEILEDPEFANLTLTLRQLYYQFVGRKWVPENTEKQYKRLGRIVTDMREAGLLDWYAIEDRGRACYFNSYQADPAKVLEGLDKMLGRDPWQDQDVYLEAWIEKQSLEPMLARPCRERRTPYMACKGYLSASEAWRAGMRFEKAIAAGKRPVLIHLGDHDPSGQDMTRDNGERLAFYARHGVEVLRVALNMDQIDQYKPPEMPSKTKDSREAGYRAKHGTKSSWELDALKPSVLNKLIGDAIDQYRDMTKWGESLKKEREMREESGLHLLSERYAEVRQLVTSPEKPLERLKLLDVELPKLIEAAGRMVEHAPTMVQVASTSTIERDAADALDHDSTLVIAKGQEPDPITVAHHEGYLTARDQIAASIAKLKPMGLRDHPDREVIAELSLAAESVGEANQPVPFVAPDKAVDNEYEPKDPDEEEQERFGDEPVKGD